MTTYRVQNESDGKAVGTADSPDGVLVVVEKAGPGCYDIDHMDANTPRDAQSVFVGTWRLLSAESRADNSTVFPWGKDPIGRLSYEASGRMAVQLGRRDRRRLSSRDWTALKPDEYREVFLSYLSYFGYYSVSGDAVIHHVEGASIADWVGSDLVRYFEFTGNRLTLRTPPMMGPDGREAVITLVWERVP